MKIKKYIILELHVVCEWMPAFVIKFVSNYFMCLLGYFSEHIHKVFDICHSSKWQ